MSQDASEEGEALLTDEDALAAQVEANAEDLRELLDLLEALQATAEDLAPGVRTAVRENREPIGELRTAFEREETMVLLQRLGDRSEELVALLDLLEAAEGLASDLTPELRVMVADNRDAVRRLRTAVERDDLLVLLERVGENADALAELLDLLEATRGLAEDLLPELQTVAGETRPDVRDLRMVAAGFADAQGEADVDPYSLGASMGNMVAVADRAGDPQVLEPLEAGLEGFGTERPPEVGPLGLVRALWDRDVRRGLGRLVEALRRMGAR